MAIVVSGASAAAQGVETPMRAADIGRTGDHIETIGGGSLGATNAPPVAEAPRFKVPATEDLDEEQRALRDQLLGVSRGGIDGIANIMLRSPKTAAGIRALGSYVLSPQTGLKPQYVELAILIQARAWSADYEWWAHVPKAIKAGIPESAIADIKYGRKPTGLEPDEEIVFNFLHQLVNDHNVTDEVYNQAVNMLGERRLVDLIAACGEYGIIAMLLKASRTQIPAGSVDPIETLR